MGAPQETARGGRLDGRVAVVVGAGQTPGDTIGNGFATALLFAREGARVLAVDRREEAAAAVAAEIAGEGGEAQALTADATDEAACRGMILKAVEQWGRLDVLHNNVGIGSGDASATRIEEADWDRILAVNLKTAVFACKYALPVMREQQSGVITNVSSVASICSTPTVAYKASKAALDAYTRSVAIANARYGIRANAILPGLMNTPMAIENISRALDLPKEELIAKRDAQVPLRGRMGTAWDVAHAALFLASDDAAFITGVCLPVDGGQSARIG